MASLFAEDSFDVNSSDDLAPIVVDVGDTDFSQTSPWTSVDFTRTRIGVSYNTTAPIIQIAFPADGVSSDVGMASTIGVTITKGVGVVGCSREDIQIVLGSAYESTYGTNGTWLDLDAKYTTKPAVDAVMLGLTTNQDDIGGSDGNFSIEYTPKLGADVDTIAYSDTVGTIADEDVTIAQRMVGDLVRKLLKDAADSSNIVDQAGVAVSYTINHRINLKVTSAAIPYDGCMMASTFTVGHDVLKIVG